MNSGIQGTAANAFGFKYQMVKGNISSTNVEEIEREDDLGYPRKNENNRERIEQLWNAYYQCLERKVMEERKPELIRMLEGQFVEFDCEICIKPFQDFNEIEWKYKPLFTNPQMTDLEYLDLAPQMIYTSNKTLKIFNIIQEFEGVYACYHGKSVISVYIMEVASNDTIEEVYNQAKRRKSSVHVEGLNLDVKYVWSKWTECSSCHTVGKRYKYGNCMTTIKPNPPKERRRYNRNAVDNVTKFLHDKYEFVKNTVQKKTSYDTTNTTFINYQNLSWVNYVIDKFKYGMPCASIALPEKVIEKTSAYKSVQVVVKYCEVPCEDSQIFEIVDSEGNAVEIANNSAGIYSVFQNLPPLPPEIERRSLEGDTGTDIIIQCPSSLLTTIPVTWKINKQIVFPKVIANESRDRITIDAVQRIHIKKLRVKDEHIYSCWQRDKLVGTVNLHVNKKFKIGFNHHVTLLGMLLVVGTFILVGIKVINRELRIRKA